MRMLGVSFPKAPPPCPRFCWSAAIRIETFFFHISSPRYLANSNLAVSGYENRRLQCCCQEGHTSKWNGASEKCWCRPTHSHTYANTVRMHKKMRTCLSLILAPNRLFIDLLQMTSLVYSIPVKLAIDLACLDYF